MYRVGNHKFITEGFNCSRATVLGNPFSLSHFAGDRNKVIRKHKELLHKILTCVNKKAYDNLFLYACEQYSKGTRYEFLQELGNALQHPSKTFLCWCKPEACHCDNYLEFTNSFRLTVSGSRSIKDRGFIFDQLDRICEPMTKVDKTRYLIGGESPFGVDSVLKDYANTRDWIYVPIPAEWNNYGKRAGMLRNIVMINLSSHFIAIWDGKSKGTEQAIKEARKRNIDCRVLTYKR